MRGFLLIGLLLLFKGICLGQEKFKVAVAGLTHGHVGWVLDAHQKGDLEILGIAESNRDLAERLCKNYGISTDLIYPNLELLLEKIQPEAITAFGNTFDHLAVVQKAAPKGVHVMVEKPLAVSLDHALQMQTLAKSHEIHLLTNYETSWYPTNHFAKELIQKGEIGDIRKVVVRDGHRGPKKIGVGKEFLNWLTDPELNGGGALMDFGCYGANLMAWLTKGERPTSVTALTQQLQPENNPKVDDEATIIVQYPDKLLIIEASWNWPMGRKDMEIYGFTGAIYADNRNDLRVRIAEGYDGYSEEKMNLPELESPYRDPFELLKSVVRGGKILPKFDLYSLENNILVMEILQAAKESAATGKTVFLKK